MHCFFFFPLFDKVYLFVADEHIFSCVTDIILSIVSVFSNLVQEHLGSSTRLLYKHFFSEGLFRNIRAYIEI